MSAEGRYASTVSLGGWARDRTSPRAVLSQWGQAGSACTSVPAPGHWLTEASVQACATVYRAAKGTGKPGQRRGLVAVFLEANPQEDGTFTPDAGPQGPEVEVSSFWLSVVPGPLMAHFSVQ